MRVGTPAARRWLTGSVVLAAVSIPVVALRTAVTSLTAGHRGRRRDEDAGRARSDLLEETRQRFDRILQQAHDDLIVVDAAGQLVWSSSGMGTGEVLTDTEQVRGLLHPDDLPAVESTVRTCMREPGGVTSTRCRLRTAHDAWRAAELICKNLLDDPIVNGVVITVRDVTEREAAQAEAARLAALHEFLTENASEVMIRLDGERRVEYVSPAVGPLLELEPADLVGVDVAMLVRPDHRVAFETAIATAAATGAVQRLDVQIEGASQDLGVWVTATVRCVIDEHGDGTSFHVSMLDVTERRAAEEALADAEALQRLILESLHEGVVLTHRRRGLVRANRAALELAGVSGTAAELGVRTVLEFVAEVREPGGDVVPLDDTPAARVLATGRPDLDRLIEMHWRDGRVTVNRVDAVPLITEDGSHDLVVTTFSDVTERIAAERELAAERQLLDATLATVRAGVVALDARGCVTLTNRAFDDLLGARAPFGAPFATLGRALRLGRADGRPGDPARLGPTLALAGEAIHDEAAQLVAADGTTRDVLLSATPLRLGDEVVGAVVTLHDVTALRRAEDDLRRLATIDPLTSLPNRRRLESELHQALVRNQRQLHRLALLFVDLDGFKAVNDSLGHDAGDELLVAVAERVVGAVRAGDLVARIGGDEFVVIAEGLDGPADAEALAERVTRALDRPFHLAAGSPRIGGSVGVAHADQHPSADSILSAADGAMYEAKRRRKQAAAA